MTALRSLALAAAATTALACVTGPKESLSGDWAGGGLFLSLRQSGGTVTGMAGATWCFTTSVSGSVHGRDFDLMVDTGASASIYVGTFTNASTISMKQSGEPNVNSGLIVLFKEPDAAPPLCVTDSRIRSP